MKTALIIVDFQNDFVCGSLGFPGAETLDGRLVQRIEQTLSAGGDLVFTYDTHGEDYLKTVEGQNLPIPHCIRGTEGWKLYGRTAAYLTDAKKVFEKQTFGCLELGEYLRQEGYDLVELAGLVSNICVLSNAIIAKAALPESEIRVDARLTASHDARLHTEALDLLENLHIMVSGREE